MTPLTIGTWNLRILLDNPSANRPERRFVLIAKELDRYNIQISALSETRLANEAIIRKKLAKYLGGGGGGGEIGGVLEVATSVVMQVSCWLCRQIKSDL